MLKEKLQIFYNDQQVENLTVSQRDPVILNASFSSINDVTPSVLWANDDSMIPCIQTNTESCAIQPNSVNITTLTYTIRATFCGKSLDIESFMLIVEGWYYNYLFTCNCLFSTSFSACYKESNTVNVATLTNSIRAIFCGKSMDVENFLLIIEGRYNNYSLRE